MTSYEGKVAFVTGAASGIGFAISKAFAASGMKVMMADIEEGPLERAVANLRAANGVVEGVLCDVTQPDAMQAAADRTIETFGKVHVLVNNAGVLVLGETGSIPLKDWRWIVDVNLMGVVHGCETFVPLMKEHGEGGFIVNTASMAGHIGLPGWGPYNATKFAVVGYTESLNAELEPQGIRAAALCPGIVKTQIGNSRRNHPGEEEAEAAAEGLAEQIEVGMLPDTLGKWVLESMENDAKHIFTHPSFRPATDMRAEGLAEAWEASENSPLIQSDPASSMTGVNMDDEAE